MLDPDNDNNNLVIVRELVTKNNIDTWNGKFLNLIHLVQNIWAPWQYSLFESVKNVLEGETYTVYDFFSLLASMAGLDYLSTMIAIKGIDVSETASNSEIVEGDYCVQIRPNDQFYANLAFTIVFEYDMKTVKRIGWTGV